MEEKIEVYETLRNELISTQEQRRNVWLYMYMLYAAMFTLGMEVDYRLLLATYIIIIPFQNIINDCTSAVSRLSAYIRVFFEDDRDDMNWEYLQLYPKYRAYYSKDHRSVIGRLKNTGSFQLALLTTIFYNIFWIAEVANRENMVFDNVELLLSIGSWGLLFLAKYVNRQFDKMDDRNYTYMIEEYRNDPDRKITEDKIPHKRV